MLLLFELQRRAALSSVKWKAVKSVLCFWLIWFDWLALSLIQFMHCVITHLSSSSLTDSLNVWTQNLQGEGNEKTIHHTMRWTMRWIVNSLNEILTASKPSTHLGDRCSSTKETENTSSAILASNWCFPWFSSGSLPSSKVAWLDPIDADKETWHTASKSVCMCVQ